MTENEFMPIHTTSEWRESRTGAKRACADTVLPSGVGKRDFTVRVVDDGRHMEISVRWPHPLNGSIEIVRSGWK